MILIKITLLIFNIFNILYLLEVSLDCYRARHPTMCHQRRWPPRSGQYREVDDDT